MPGASCVAIQTEVTVTQKESIAPAWWRLTLAAPNLVPRPLPGQYLLLRCADRFTCYLRRPVFPAPVDDQHVDLLVRPDPDPGLAWLAARKPGDRLDVIGPLGTGFPLGNHVRNLLLVADNQAIGPLLGQLARAVTAGLSVALALGGNRAATLYPAGLLPPEVEVQLATLDGSVGHRGPVTDLLPDLLRWADIVCAVGSTAFYRALKREAARFRFRVEPGFLFGLVCDNLFPCGTGACLACAVETESGLKLACLDGPVFDLMALNL